jgi:hypothetical protein
MKYMFDRSRTRFQDKNVAQDFFCAVSKVFDSPMVRKTNNNKKDHKGLRFRS